MKYLAMLFMCNDEKRAEFVIENFNKHNPEIHLVVYNGGKSAKYLSEKYDIELIEGRNVWHNKTRHSPGSFDYEWFELLFKMHEKYDPDYLIFLETDVKVNRKIQKEPEYDIAGPVVSCGMMEQLVMYDYWDSYIKGENFHEDRYTNWDHKFHTGMGATALSRNFFQTCKSKLNLVKQCYELIPFNCYQDVLITCFARSCGCSMGDWSEVSDTRGTKRKITDKQWRSESCDNNAALIHNYKI